MDTESFPFNCGARVVGDFGHSDDYETVKEAITASKVDLSGEIFNTDARVMFATTSPFQEHAVAALKFQRFRAIANWPGEQGRITLWMKRFRTHK